MQVEISLMQKLGLKPVKNTIPVVVYAHDYLAGCTLAKTYGIDLVLPLQPNLPVSSQIKVSLSSNDIALSNNYISGISMQNQIKGKICTLIFNKDSVLVQIDCGSIWLANLTLKACRDMGLQEGKNIYCLAKTHAFSYCLNANIHVLQPLLESERLT
jgi:molybdate transport system ATP-binding protein